MRFVFIIAAFFITAIFFSSAARSNIRSSSLVDSIPNYNRLYYWAAHPWQKDPAHSVPAGLLNEIQDSLVDVFFVHPTSYTGKLAAPNANASDAALNQKTDFSSILYQASAFNQHARVFAPRYRQAHISAFYTDTVTSRKIFDTAYADVKRAFEYYLAHYHQNRPIIIAGHSQGALLAEWLLKEFFDGTPLQQNLVAAYIIGWPIPQNYFAALPVCATPDQTSCFCGWRTFRTGYVPAYIEKEKPPSYVVNPLTWTTDSGYAKRTLNKGSVLRHFNQVVPHTTDAQIKNGVLWVSRPRFPGGVFYTARNYHIADINLFYLNIRRNVESRIRAFLKTSP